MDLHFSDQGILQILAQHGYTLDEKEQQTWKKFTLDKHDFVRSQMQGTKIDEKFPTARDMNNYVEEIPMVQKIAGHKHGLSFLLVNEVHENDLAFAVTDGVGFMVE